MSLPNRSPGVSQMPQPPGFVPFVPPTPPNIPSNQPPNWGINQSVHYSAPREIPFSPTTAFIGNIPECAPDCLIRQLAEKCGCVITWKRSEGSNGKPQAFAFCDFRHPESTLCALRLLDGYKVADNALVVKVNSKSRCQLEEYLRLKMPGVPIPKIESKPPLNAETAAIRAQFDALVREYAGVLAGDPEAIRTMRIDAREARDVCSIDRDNRKCDDKKSKESSDAEDAEEMLRLDKEARDKELAYMNALKNWESRERKRKREVEKEAEKQEEKAKAALRDVKMRYEFMSNYRDERDDAKYYRSSHYVHARERELEWDNRDRERELKETDDIKRKIIERGGRHVNERLLAVDKNLVSHLTGEVVGEIESSEEEEVEEIKEEEKQEEDEPFKFTVVEQEEEAQIGFASIKLPSTVEPNKEATTTVPIFVEEEEEEVIEELPKPKLNISEHVKYISAEEKKRYIKNMIEKIPTDPVKLFATEIDWSVVDKNLVDTRIRSWVNKKIIEYTGEEEQSLNDFICQKIMARTQPRELIDNIWTILDQEAEVFVVKLWRLLVFETQSKIAGINNS